MDTTIYGPFRDRVILQINSPKLADVSAEDYSAEKLNDDGVADNVKGVEQPFVVCHNEDVTLKVQTWKGVTIVWNFTAGPYPMPLRKIFKDAGNTATSIQIGY